MKRKLYRYPGGLKLKGHKGLSSGRPIATLPLPAELVLPLSQHIGAPAQPCVRVGERVLKGQMIAQSAGPVSAPLHAPTSGSISAIEERPVPHPSGLTAPCIILTTDGQDEWCELTPHDDSDTLEPEQLRQIIRDAGIVGLGGAGFPAHIKLNPGARTAVNTLILNGAECEPYISCDDALMRSDPTGVISGARIMRHALQARCVVIAIEDNKPEAIAAIGHALAQLGERDIEVVTVPTRYPTGGEKQLITVITGKEVPTSGLPLDIGVVVHNIATAASVNRAVAFGEPLISRVITVTGEQVVTPQNFEVLLGTSIALLLEAAGGVKQQGNPLVMGGPMMGFPVSDTTLPMIKTSNCLLAKRPEPAAPTRPCIRCGECARVCPVRLQPQQLYWHARGHEFEKAQDQMLFACIECGCCAWVCPSNIPLVHYYRFAKSTIWAQEREHRAAELARERHEFREARKAREKAERAELMRTKKAALAAKEKKAKESSENPANEDAVDPKKAAIQAALERAKAKRAAIAAKNTDNLTPEQQAKIAEIDARRRAQQDEEQSNQ